MKGALKRRVQEDKKIKKACKKTGVEREAWKKLRHE